MRRLLPLFGIVAACAAPSAASSVEESLTAEACPPVSTCAATAELAFTTRAWRHEAPVGTARVRARDLFVETGATQMVLGKVAYGSADTIVVDEEVDVFVERDCAWTKLGTARTTAVNEHAEVEGVKDDGGRVYFEIPAAKALGPGRHRVKIVVAGDGTAADALLDVVPAGTPMFVSDVDGTLTANVSPPAGMAGVAAMLKGDLPGTHADAAAAFQMLVGKGYRPMYLTGRPEWLTQRTRDFLAANGFPEGVVHASPSANLGDATFKPAALANLRTKGLVPAFGFGDSSADVAAYAVIARPEHRFFWHLDGPGRRIDAYADVLPLFAALPAACVP